MIYRAPERMLAAEGARGMHSCMGGGLHSVLPCLLIGIALGCASHATGKAVFVETPCGELDESQMHLPIKRVAPRYPQNAVVKSIDGHVVMRLHVTDDGGVSGAEIIESRPPRVFEGAAKDAVLQWRYCPASQIASPFPDPLLVRLEFVTPGPPLR